MGKRPYTPIPDEWLEEMGELGDAEYGRLIRWCQTYNITGEEGKLNGNERFYLKRCKNAIDRCLENYAKISEVRSVAGKIGADARWNKDGKGMANDSKRQQTDGKNGYSESYSNSYSESSCSIPPIIPPQGDDAPKPKQVVYPAGFIDFWEAYPKKVGKQAAVKSFARAVKTVDLQTILNAVEQQKHSAQWTRDNGQYIPNPATWLNQGRWDDEATEVQQAPVTNKAAQDLYASYRMMDDWAANRREE